MTSKQLFSGFISFLFFVLFSHSAFAGDMNDLAESIADSTSRLPALIAGFAYLSGLLLATSAIFKSIDHVSNPTQTPIRVPVIRFLIGGALFALPIITEAAITTINGGTITTFTTSDTALYDLSGAFGALTGYLTVGNVNSVMGSIVFSMGQLPALVAMVAYLLALITTVSALYKTRDHVEDPERVPLKDAVIRFITAGLLFGLPTAYEAMYTTINSGGFGFAGAVLQLVSGINFIMSTESATLLTDCNVFAWVSGTTLGDVMCTLLQTTSGLPKFLTIVSYLLGTILGLWAIIKIRDHVNNPSQTALHEGISRLLAAGAFFALPMVALSLQYSVTPNVLAVAVLVGTNTGFVSGTPTCGSANSLDVAMACFMDDILGPSHVLLNFFCFVAGLIFVMIGISRLTKSAQEGARGPGGIGTVTTFLIGGLLMSATTILRAISGSLFGVFGMQTATTASLAYTGTMTAAETAAAYNVIDAVLKFMIVIGMISFVRGLFIMRDVSEGSQGASTMAGMTHIMGGALAVNLGPVINAVQATLGITTFGVTFS
ncbi:MAG: hypothetical protein COB14_03480 [Alphaproteobacteria bacterium]|nr:MAG: hypothetical protein COB14_03480 [Alphaproteobacteria bacterium]